MCKNVLSVGSGVSYEHNLPGDPQLTLHSLLLSLHKVHSARRLANHKLISELVNLSSFAELRRLEQMGKTRGKLGQSVSAEFLQ